MKIKLSLFFLICILASCSKDNFSDKPMLKLKSVVPSPVVPVGATLTFTFEYTDAQGDLALMPVCIEKISSLSPCFNIGLDPSFLDTTFFTIDKDVPPSTNQKGEIIISLTRTQYAGDKRCNESQPSEEAIFKFWITDQAGNHSDTLTLDPLTILKQ